MTGEGGRETQSRGILRAWTRSTFHEILAEWKFRVGAGEGRHEHCSRATYVDLGQVGKKNYTGEPITVFAILEVREERGG